MKYIYTYILIFAIFLIYAPKSVFAENNYYEDRIILKIANDSKIDTNRLSKILGNYKLKPAISENVLKLFEQKILSRTKPNSSRYFDAIKRIDNLSSIFIIEYQSGADALLSSVKISAMNGIEYAEPLYLRYFNEKPNDPDIDFQYYLTQIEAYKSWGVFTSSDSIIVAVIDTGIDFEHEDLEGKIYINSGETGEDNEGADKSSNGIDDDDNGFIDDWRGWDFVSSDSSGQDNDPSPGNQHGTHVAGIIGATINNHKGIAGVAKYSHLLTVKIGYDDPENILVENSFDGILYSAAMGAKIINCSWSGIGEMLSEQEIINAVTDFGALVVGAAGNNGIDIKNYPASYKGAMSVVSTNEMDKKSAFSTFNLRADISAPGSNIYSTMPDDKYDYMSGTSMAAPIVSAVAAAVSLKYPGLSPIQIMERLKACSDYIDDKNYEDYQMKMGRGRVNAYKAVSSHEVKSIILKNYYISDSDGDNIWDAGDTLGLTLEMTNVLDDIKRAYIKTDSRSQYKMNFIADSIFLGDMQSMETKSPEQEAFFIIPENIPSDYNLILEIAVYDEEEYINSEYIEINLRPSYRTMSENNIAITFNSVGNIGFNDYPLNKQGKGFRYKSGSNLLFEGSFMAGIDYIRVSNAARSSFVSEKDMSFISEEVFEIKSDKTESGGHVKFRDNNDDLYDVGVAINQNAYQFSDPGGENFILISYEVENTIGEDFDSLFAGLFMDWNIGSDIYKNYTYFDVEDSIVFIYNTENTNQPYIGIELLSEQKYNYFPINNDGTTEDNPGINDRFDRVEKWKMLSSGIYKLASDTTDISIMISGGPIKLKAGEKSRFTFAIYAGKSINDIKKSKLFARNKAYELSIGNRYYAEMPEGNRISKAFPNPNEGAYINYNLEIIENAVSLLELFDSDGKIIHTFFKDKLLRKGRYFNTAQLPSLNAGAYFLRLKSGYFESVIPLIISK